MNTNRFLPDDHNELNDKSLITELAFQLVLDSEETEDFGFDLQYFNIQNAPSITHIDKKIILEFLSLDETRVFVRHNPMTDVPQLVATNLISHESIVIEGLAGHYLTLLEVVDKAEKHLKHTRKNKDTDSPLITHDFIKNINESIQPVRAGEVGIGEYRSVDFLGRPIKVCIGRNVDDTKVPYKSLELAEFDAVKPKMKELVDWVNSEEFKEKCKKDIYLAVAEFHARFIKIHPFRDGNGRTVRLLTNYILLSFGKPIVTIPIEDKYDYNNALNFANVTSLKEAAEEFKYFDKYLVERYNQTPKKQLVDHILNKGKSATTPSFEEVIDNLEEYRKNYRYQYLGQFLKNHQVPQNAKSVTKQILNDYGRRSVDLFVSLGKPKVRLSPDYIADTELVDE